MMRFLTISAFLLLLAAPAVAQDTTQTGSSNVDNQYDEDGNPVYTGKKKGFHIGMIVGAYFANQGTAKLYDGYGFDADNNRNSFENSFMYNKIVMQYGGGYGQPDQIATALGVQHGEWSFGESDMPVNMRYQPAFLFGLQCRYSVDPRNAVLLNVNAVQLNVNGNFTIETTPPTGSTQVNQAVKTFAIRGTEQRLIFQVAYQRILGDITKKANFFVEGGMNITMSKFGKNQILINGLLIDLTSYYYQPGYNAYYVQKLIGTGFGAFAGLGINLNANPKFRAQFVYNPSYENIKLGIGTSLKLQNAVGLRFYYNL